MKLHHLYLRGIGPFRGEVEIDFAALGASGMFLLEGPTGSGKSTILDALVFALYGNVAGAGASSDRIRSQFAPPTTASVVDLIFETAQGIFRVRREPEYRRAKRRGTGTTKEQAKAVLWRIGSPDLIPALVADEPGDGAGLTPLATRLDEVGREIARAVGLSHSQFTQTVLLPQGEFARFLRARTGERQQVLQRVFGTEIYEDVEKRLEEMRREASAQVERATAELSRAVARFVEATGLAADEAGEQARENLEAHAAALHLEDLGEASSALVDQAAEAGAAAAGRADKLRAEALAARTAADTAAAALARIDRRRALDQLAARLEKDAAQAAEARACLEADRAAQPVAEAIARRDRARRQEAEAAAGLAALRDQHAADHAELVALLDGPAPLEELDRRIDAATTAAGELTALVALEKELPQRRRELAARSTRLETAQAALAALETSLAQRPEARTALLERRDAARTAAEGLADARLALDAATQRRDHAKRAQDLSAQVETARTRARTARRAADEAAETEAQLRRRRNAGLAAELALALVDGDPCPVCGAQAHPHPAEPGADHVDAETVDAAEEARRRAERTAADAKEALALAESRHDDAAERAGGLTLEAALAAHEQLSAQLTTLQEQQALVAELETEIEAHDEEDRRLAAQREAQALAASTEQTSIREAAAALEADAARVDAAREQSATVAERRAAHTATARAARALRDAHVAADQAAARARELAAEVRLGDFADDAAVRSALLAPARRTELEEMLQRRRTDQARLADGLAEDGIAELDAGDAARERAQQACTDTRARAAAAEEATTVADKEAGRRESVLAASRLAQERLHGAITQVRSVSAEATTVVRVADLATGRSSDGDRIQLSTYVLMRRFEDVIDAANARLALFSDSDLELLRDPGARGAKKTGLDLLVIDRRTDQTRVPETLSGGETFFVSLALALGLADIVTAEAGGVQMETLFIDEGFGSLDPESLERVIGEISSLAAHGRTIGLVSHVTEMKQQIPEQIRVRRREDGSSAVTATA
ncbi:DNA repair protein [Brachybacterium phenoliresistens]|uniref:Nuclease SbcCD subunit C n=1 Tax=Brachybacterium phenoliresistens TaxID=396014 RepID=Z9JTA6_9MICO|nr:SMC family ATPase [Brachybacterium phenoliresistens]EWS81434.1 DNA repair protein [Brachybacterium phenoliresistens]